MRSSRHQVALLLVTVLVLGYRDQPLLAVAAALVGDATYLCLRDGADLCGA